MMALKFPGPTDRVSVIGRTGSGKTTAGLWHLSGKDFNVQPWLMVNTKGDPHVNSVAAIEGVKTLTLDQTPGERGLYHVMPTPEQGVDLDAMLGRIWAKQNCGIYIDEGYMIEPTTQLNSCLTQGRTRGIPMIILSQRPAWISKFVFSECEYVQLFNLQRQEDRKTVGGFVPVDKNYRLDRYCSYWYNVNDDDLRTFGPVPKMSVIIETFRAKFPPEHAQGTDAEGKTVPWYRQRVTPRVI